jgi:hypothetical protein
MSRDLRTIAKTWLDREDSTCAADRRARLEWVAGLTPVSEFLSFPGGWVAKYLFEESRYCFVYGQFMAAVVLGLAFAEHTLAAEFYAAGRNDLERASITVLLREGRDAGWLTDEEYGQLDEIRTLRNPLTHFRAPLWAGTVEHRSVTTDQMPYDVLEKDARMVMVAVFHLLGRNAV